MTTITSLGGTYIMFPQAGQNSFSIPIKRIHMVHTNYMGNKQMPDYQMTVYSAPLEINDKHVKFDVGNLNIFSELPPCSVRVYGIGHI